MNESVVFNSKVRTKTNQVTFENAWRYGQFFNIVVLKDGREIGFSADKVLITDTGDLIGISTGFTVDTSKERGQFEVPKTVIALAKGEWVAHYSASAVTGDPIGIDWFDQLS